MAEPFALVAFLAAGSAEATFANLLSWVPYSGFLLVFFVIEKAFGPVTALIETLRKLVASQPQQNQRALGNWARLARKLKHLSRVRRLWAATGTYLRVVFNK